MNSPGSGAWRQLLLLTVLLAAIPTVWKQIGPLPGESNPTRETCAPGEPLISLLQETSLSSSTVREPEPAELPAAVQKPASSDPQAGVTAEVATGQIRGVVRFLGESPLAPEANLAGKRLPLLRVDPQTGGLGHAVVFIVNGGQLPQPSRPEIPAARPVPVQAVMDQKDHEFTPRVVAITAGAGVRFTNSDVANHNVHGHGLDPKNQFNVFTGSGGGVTHRFRVEKGGRPIRIGCDIHPWMQGWVYVFDHPWYAITDNSGKFEIPDVPVGRHRLVIRQPDTRLEKFVEIEVVAGQVVEWQTDFESSDLPRE